MSKDLNSSPETKKVAQPLLTRFFFLSSLSAPFALKQPWPLAFLICTLNAGPVVVLMGTFDVVVTLVLFGCSPMDSITSSIAMSPRHLPEGPLLPAQGAHYRLKPH